MRSFKYFVHLLPGEARMCFWIVAQAMADYTNSDRNSDEFRSAVRWFLPNVRMPDKYPFSFEACCAILGFDHTYIFRTRRLWAKAVIESSNLDQYKKFGKMFVAARILYLMGTSKPIDSSAQNIKNILQTNHGVSNDADSF